MNGKFLGILFLLSITLLFGCIQNDTGQAPGPGPIPIDPSTRQPIERNPGDSIRTKECTVPKINISQIFSAPLKSAQGNTRIEFNPATIPFPLPATAKKCYYYQRSGGLQVQINPRQSINVKGDARMDGINTAVNDLVEYINSEGDYNYQDNFAVPIPVNLNFASGDVAFIPFMGGRYKVLQINAASTPAEGIESVQLQNMANNETFMVVNGKGFPYDPSNPYGPWDWKAEINSELGNTDLYGITLVNNMWSIVWDTHNPLYPPVNIHNRPQNEAKFLEGTGHALEGFARTTFEGFPGPRPVNIRIGENRIEFKDMRAAQHNIPMRISLSESRAGNAFVFDTMTVYYRNDMNDSNILIPIGTTNINGQQVQLAVSGTNLSLSRTDTGTSIFGVGNSQIVSITNVLFTCSRFGAQLQLTCEPQNGGNVTFARAPINAFTVASDYLGNIGNYYNKTIYYNNLSMNRIPNLRVPKTAIPLEGSNSQTYNYRILVNDQYAPLMSLLIDYQAISVEYNKKIQFDGTDLDESGDFMPDAYFYYPDQLETGGNPSDNAFYIARFTVVEDTLNLSWRDSNLLEYFETTRGLPIFFPNNNLSFYTYDVRYRDQFSTSPNFLWGLRNDQPYMQGAFTDYGSKVWLDLNASNMPLAVQHEMPVQQDQVSMRIRVNRQ